MMLLLGLLVVYAIALNLYLERTGFRAGPSRPAAPVAPPPRPTRVLLVGATGGTGRELVTQALSRGYAVTALARDPAKVEVKDARLTVVRGDVLDPGTLDEALRDCGAVLCALGHKKFLGPTTIQSAGTGNLIDAMRRHGAARLVVETSLGLGDSAGRLGLVYSLLTLPLVLPFYFADKARQEQVVAGSDLDWVIVRPGALTFGRPTGRCRHGTGAKAGDYLWTRSIARADVAAFMLDQLTDDTYLRTAPGLSS